MDATELLDFVEAEAKRLGMKMPASSEERMSDERIVTATENILYSAYSGMYPQTREHLCLLLLARRSKK